MSGEYRPHIARYDFISPNLCNDMHGDPKCGAGYNIFGIGPYLNDAASAPA